MTSDELRTAISRLISDSAAGEIADERGDLFSAYMAEPYGDEAPNRSQVVSTDISDTVEWILPELMEIFTSGDRVVRFEPLGPDDEERADQETDTVNHVFLRQNEGFLALYSMFKDALIQKNGYVKRWWDERETTRIEEYEGLAPEELLAILADLQRDGAKVELIEDKSDERGLCLKMRVTEKTERVRVAPVPPEELLIHPRWNSVFLDQCPFVAHRQRMTISDLIEQGFDREQLLKLGRASDEEFGEERIERFTQRGSEETTDGEPADESMTEVMVHECYIRTDFDGDGIAELRKVTVGGAGHEILRTDEGEANEEVMSVPFSALTPVIVPHRHFGRSVAELVKDLQRIKTALLRNTLDNFYATQNPTREIAEDGIGENTIEDLLVDRPGKIVRTALPGMYVEHTPPQFAMQAMGLIEYIDTVRENRTGVSRLSQGLDANTINKTARGQSLLMTAAQKKIALIARIFAETGVKDLFRGIHETLRQNASKALTIRLRGTWVRVDPREWRSRADVAANVALGVGNAEQQLQKLMMIAERQEQNLLQGSPLVTLDNLHHTYVKMVEAAGFKNSGAFFTDPKLAPPPAPPPPDPQLVLVQGQLENERAKIETNAQEAMGKMQIEVEKARADAAAAREELAIKSAETAAKIDLMHAQIAKIRAEISHAGADLQLRSQDAAHARETSAAKMFLDAQKAGHDMTMAEKQAQRPD